MLFDEFEAMQKFTILMIGSAFIVIVLGCWGIGNLCNKRLEIEKQKIEKWDGKCPLQGVVISRNA